MPGQKERFGEAFIAGSVDIGNVRWSTERPKFTHAVIYDSRICIGEETDYYLEDLAPGVVAIVYAAPPWAFEWSKAWRFGGEYGQL